MFAEARAAPASVLLPVTDKAEYATAVLDDGQVVIRAVVESADLPIFASAPIAGKGPTTLLGVVVPRAGAVMRWEAAAGDRATVSIRALPVVREPAPVADQVACESIGVVPIDFDARAWITKRAKLPTRWVAGAGASLQQDLRAKPAAVLAAGVEVELLEVKGKMSRILCEAPSVLATGWVPSVDLTSQAQGAYGYGTGRGTFGRTVARFHGDTCSRDLPIVAEMGEQRARVGLVRAGTSFRIVAHGAADSHDAVAPPSEPAPRWVRVELPLQTWLLLDPAARIVVAADDLARCSR